MTLPPTHPPKSGRPRKGVVRVSITLLPHVRDGLARSPLGISGEITRLYEQALLQKSPVR